MKEWPISALTIAFHSGDESRRCKDDLATLEAARSWSSDLSRFKNELKSLIVQGDPSCNSEGSSLENWEEEVDSESESIEEFEAFRFK